MQRIAALLLLTATCIHAGEPVPPDHPERMAKGLELFKSDIRQILIESCLDCHGGKKLKGDFDLATREGLLKGGAEGLAVTPFKAAGSAMMKRIRHEEEPVMPEKADKLSDAKIAKLAQWIDNGAPYDKPLIEGKAAPRNRAVVTDEDRQWWSFQRLKKVAPPAVTGAASPIDAFLLKAAETKKLAFNPPTDRRRLIRRAYLDLIGVPPTPEEVQAFVADPATDAFQKLVDRLLDSPQYGERWARHWLDVARFAESSGFEHDYDRPHAFHYRDFVIKALNADMPYDQFVRWQIAGDEYEPENPLAMMATGFLGAGVFPTQITANEVERVRYDAMDDMLSTVGSGMLGLTIGCARCHDHKFDPIPDADYYRMLSTFTTTVRSNVDLILDPQAYARDRAKHDAEHAQLTGELESYENNELRPRMETWLANNPQELPRSAWALLDVAAIKSKGGATFKKLDDNSWLASGKNTDSDVYTITAATTRRRLTGIKLEALADASMKSNGPGRASNGNFALSRIKVSVAPATGGEAKDAKLLQGEVSHEQNKTNLSLASSLDENPKSGWAVDLGGIGKDQAAVFLFAEPVDFEGGAKLTITLEFAVNTGHNIGRPRFSVFSDAEPRLKGDVLPAAVADLTPKLHDPALRAALTAAELDALFEWWKTRDAAWRERNVKVVEHAKLAPNPKTPVMVCAEGHTPIRMHSQGADFFNETYQLKRGDTNQKNGVAKLGFLQVLTPTPGNEERWTWTPPAGTKISGRRRSLTNWMTDVDNGAGGLLARVAVNRLWQHHFGRGIVSTPNDFGHTGALPSNPELLDWLAGELIRSGWSMKSIHRMLMTSSAYQQSAATDKAKVSADLDNAFFMRRVPQRLEAEAVRDSMLAVCGILDKTPFGKGTLDENSRRRSVYFTVKRSQLVNSMLLFDAPEPLVSQGSRPVTTVAPQALMMMNSPQLRAWAEAFAKRVQNETKDRGDAIEPLVARAYALALGRAPRADEMREAVAFIGAGQATALADFCQLVLALNEFVYVD